MGDNIRERMKIYNFIYKDIDGEIDFIDNVLNEYMKGGGNEIKFVDKWIKLTNPKALLFHLGNEYRILWNLVKCLKTNEEALEVLDKLNEKYQNHKCCTHFVMFLLLVFEIKV